MKPVIAISSIIIILLIASCIPNAYSQLKEPANKDGMWVGGKIIWPGHDLSNATVELYKDPKFTDLYTSGILFGDEGIYSLNIKDAGTYYIVAFVDDNDSGKFDAGDGMGMYGVAEWSDSGQKPVPVQISAGMRRPNTDIAITAISSSQGSMVPISLPKSEIITGISGKLVWPGHKLSNAILFIYSDPSWNNRIAQANIQETGEYEISIPAGRYYLLAVVDENKTNLLDVGDKFGIWGMTRLGMFPKAVEVKDGQITKDRNILVTGQMSIGGKPLPLQEAAKAEADQAAVLGDKVILTGNVVWPDHELQFGMVQAYSDPSMTVTAAQAKADDKGAFRLLVPAGEYYLMAGVDVDKDGKYSSGDGIGAYGVVDVIKQMPEKLIISADSQNPEITLLITAVLDDSGQLVPIEIQQDVVADASAATFSTGITGVVTWEGRRLLKALLVFSDEARFEGGTGTPLELGDDGSYSCATPPGDYYIMVIADINENNTIDLGDGRGVYGSGYRGTPQKVTVLEDRITPNVNISITELFDSDGKKAPIKTAGSLLFWYGKPGNLYTNTDGEQVTQEWWYWSRGETFVFEETEAGLNLLEIREFTPINPDAPPKRDMISSDSGEGESDGAIYYTFDRVIWTVDPDGKNRQWVVTGTQPTGTIDGNRLLFLDTDGSIYLIEPGNENETQLILERRKSGLQPAVSHSGKAVAFTHVDGGQRKIILKNVTTEEDSDIPAPAMDMYHPAWSSNDEVIAYAAALLSADPHDLNRDIYRYDLATNRTERVTTSPLDEFEPAWSPVNQTLAFCRAEDSHSQIWIIDFSDADKPTERQLTKFGGKSPAWSPDGGMIIYENNAQLWTVALDGSGEVPIIVDDKPVFGLDPFWTR